MSKRNPRKDPIPGDVISHPFGEHKVLRVEGGIVFYLDEGLRDFVPLEKWRHWYVGRRGISVIARGPKT